MNRDRAKEDVMSRVQFPCLWFDGNAEEAAELYVSLLPDSRITKVWRAPAETSWKRSWLIGHRWRGAGGNGCCAIRMRPTLA